MGLGPTAKGAAWPRGQGREVPDLSHQSSSTHQASSIMAPYGFMATWLHCFVVICLNGYVSLWLFDYMAQWRNGYVAIWLHGYMPV